MHTLKRFTEAAAGFAMLVALTACVSLPSSTSSEPVGPSDQRLDERSGETPFDFEPLPVEVSAESAADFQSAVALIQAGRYQQAEAVLLEITHRQPELAGPWFNLGKVYLALERSEAAAHAFEQAALANPSNCTILNELGVLSRRAGDFEAAEARYLQCIESTPDHGVAHLNLGILYELYLGRLADALDHYRRYQLAQPEPDKRVAGWVVDLERRLGV